MKALGLKRWLHRARGQPAAVEPTPRPSAEPLEPRVLYAADPLGTAGVLAAQAEVRVLQVEDVTAAPAAEVVGNDSASADDLARQSLRHEVVFIDSRVPDRELLIDDLVSAGDPLRRIQVVVIGTDEDAFDVIGSTLAGHSWTVGGRDGDGDAQRSNDVFAPRRLQDDRSPAEQLLLTLTQPEHMTGVTLTAGLVWWITRSGGVVASAVMGVPVWRQVDLLPVAVAEEPDEAEETDEEADELPRNAASKVGWTESWPSAADDEVEALFERGQGVPVPAGSPRCPRGPFCRNRPVG